MFYNKFIYLCSTKKVTPSRAATEAGISRSLVTKWKKNRTQVPSPDILRKLSAYFSVPVSVLLSEEKPTAPEKTKETPGEIKLIEDEIAFIKLLRRIPAEQQPMVLAMIRAALYTEK